MTTTEFLSMAEVKAERKGVRSHKCETPKGPLRLLTPDLFSQRIEKSSCEQAYMAEARSAKSPRGTLGSSHGEGSSGASSRKRKQSSSQTRSPAADASDPPAAGGLLEIFFELATYKLHDLQRGRVLELLLSWHLKNCTVLSTLGAGL